MGSVRRDFPQPSVSTRRLAGAVLGAFAFVALTAAGCTDQQKNIVVGNASRADVTEVVDASASVTAKAVAVLAAPADGTVAALSVQPGQTVTAGQPLAVIDSPAARDRLAQAERALDALSGGGPGPSSSGELVAVQRRTDHDATAAFKQAREHAAAVTDPTLKAALLAQVEAGERAYRDAAAAAQALINSVQRGLAGVGQAMGALTAAQRVQAQAAYDVAKSAVDALALTAPIAGVVQLGGVASGPATPSLGDLIGAATGAGPAGLAAPGAGPGSGAGAAQRSGPGVDSAVLPGARVSAGTPVVTVVDTSELGLVAEVDETDVLLVTPGVTAGVELDAAPGARYDAAVRSVDLLPGASPRGGVSYRVRLSVGDGKYSDGRAAPTPRPGMSAVAHLAVRAARDTVAVPAAAVFGVGGREAVWVVRNGHAVRAPVTVGVSGQDLVQVVAGVAAGDRIVVRGADQVRVGQQLP
jgi:multidrug efflux pump subunit AcrA (membrane-fusion protein)